MSFVWTGFIPLSLTDDDPEFTASFATTRPTRNLDQWIEQLKEATYLSEEQTTNLCQMVLDILIDEKNVIELSSPISICGDLHGQFFDVLQLFLTGGEPPNTKYLFLGDFVDRGHHSVLTISLLFAFKARYPDSIYLLRGNHETRSISQIYGFYDECLTRFGDSCHVWKQFMKVFDHLPIAALVDGNIFCVHGGLSPKIDQLDEISQLRRNEEIPSGSPIADLVWSDPDYLTGGLDWEQSPRGAGWLFGEGPTEQFMVENSLRLIVRSHQLVMEGFNYMFSDSLVTIWSAPNYCYKCGNKAGMLNVSGMVAKVVQFDASTDSAHSTPGETFPSQYFL